MPQFDEYDRITDIVMYLSSNVSLNFNVILSRGSKNNERIFFQYETEFKSKYIGTNISRNIKRIMNFYWTIDIKDSFGTGLLFRPQDVAILEILIKEKVLPWFVGQGRIFSLIDKDLFITGEFTPVIYNQDQYKSLKLEPIVIEYQDGTKKEGLVMSINNAAWVEIDFDKFIGFYRILTQTDMYSVACAMANYAKIPPHGINIYGMKGLGAGYIPDEYPEESSGSGTGKSFLDSAKSKK